MLISSLLLGLSTGTYCAMFCAPVILPMVFSANGGMAANARLIGFFSLGRLLGYVIIGAALGALGAYGLGFVDPTLENRISTAAWAGIGALLLIQGLSLNFPHAKACRVLSRVYLKDKGINAAAMGLLTGLNLCPPFIAASGEAISSRSPLWGAMGFLFFFLGTSVYFLPLLGVPLLGKKLEIPRLVARVVLVLLGLYFFLCRGILSWR
jgi:sulfite exporter TauE/SafE